MTYPFFSLLQDLRIHFNPQPAPCFQPGGIPSSHKPLGAIRTKQLRKSWGRKPLEPPPFLTLMPMIGIDFEQEEGNKNTQLVVVGGVSQQEPLPLALLVRREGYGHVGCSWSQNQKCDGPISTVG